MKHRPVVPSQSFAVAFIDVLIRAGLKHAVVSPGSRSQALALELARREIQHDIQLHVRIDEREAGFLALGIARSSKQPVLVVTTSGSAVGNLHPSVLEAHHSRVPVIYATADRPDELHGIEANQTTDQAHMFGATLRGLIDVPAAHNSDDALLSGVSAAMRAWNRATGQQRNGSSGPVQVNVGFREPLSSSIGQDDRGLLIKQISEIERDVKLSNTQAAKEATVQDAVIDSLATVTVDGRPTMVVAGASYGVNDDDGRLARRVAEQLQAPLFAEVVSTARRSPLALPRPHALLESAAGTRLIAECERVIVFGKPTLHRAFVRLLSRSDLDIVVVAPTGEHWSHFSPSARRAAGVEVSGSVPSSWLSRWRSCAAHQSAIAENASMPSAVSLVRAVGLATRETDAVMFAASSLVRVADNVLPHGIPNVFANRGLAGIDGTLSTAVGIALGREQGITRLVVGDLTLLYGVGGLLLGMDEDQPPLQIVVGNDHGGSIFDNLEVAAADPELFRRVMRTEQSVDICQLAAAYGWAVHRVTSQGALKEVLDTRKPGVIEVVLR